MARRILVIDDDEAVRKLFLLTLEDTGYQVDMAASGRKGIEMMTEVKYDLIYLDLKMPEMDGVETLRELRKIDGEVLVYLITAFHEEFFEQLKGAANDGLDFEVFRKPFDSKQLIEITKSILEGPKEVSGVSFV